VRDYPVIDTIIFATTTTTSERLSSHLHCLLQPSEAYSQSHQTPTRSTPLEAYSQSHQTPT